MTADAELYLGRILLKAPLHYNDAIKALPGSEFENGRWTVPLSWGSCLRLRALFGNELNVWPELTAWATKMKLDVVDPNMALRDKASAPGDLRLYEFQRAGALFMSRGSCLLGDEVGSGKTVQSIMSKPPTPILVVAPKSMLFKWQREFNKWWPELDVRVATGSASVRRKAIEMGDVVVINWENTWRHSRLAPFGSIHLTDKDRTNGDLNNRAWATVILDEAHNASSPTAKQTRAAWAICHMPSVQKVYGLTGTPITGKLDDLWAIMHAIDPAEYPSKSKWVSRYAEQSFNMFGGLEIKGVKPEMREEFFSILDYRFRRMPKEITLPDLPPIMGGLSDTSGNGLDVREIEMEPKQAKAYKEMIEKMVAELESGVVVTTRPITKILRAMMFAQAYASVTDYQTEEGWQQDFELVEPSNKVDAVLDILEEFKGEPVVFFAASRQLIDLCSARLTKKKINHGLIIGGQGALERQEQIDLFQAGQLPAMLAVVSAGATGIDLNTSRVEVVLHRSDSLVENIQMEGRVHRIGSEVHENVRIIDVVSKGTIEPNVAQRLFAKDDRLQEICRDNATLAKFLKGE